MVLGIDFSTWAVDVVGIDEDTGRADWWRYELAGQDAFERTRRVREVMPARGHWDDLGVIAIGIEEPAGANTRPLNRVQGAILACLPFSVLVEPIRPSDWRKRVGLPGGCDKAAVAAWVRAWLPETLDWPQDAYDALCLAVAVRSRVTFEAVA